MCAESAMSTSDRRGPYVVGEDGIGRVDVVERGFRGASPQ